MVDDWIPGEKCVKIVIWAGRSIEILMLDDDNPH